MKSIGNDYLKKVINEAVKGMLKEDGGLGGPGLGGPGLGGPGLGGPGLGGPGLGGPGLGGPGLGAPAGGFKGTSSLVGNTQGSTSTEGGKMADGTHLPKVLNARFEKWHEDENPNRDTATNDDEILKVDIGYIYPMHQEYLRNEWEQKYKDIFTAQWFGYGKDYMEFRVKPDKEQEFINVLSDVFNDIADLDGVQPKFYPKKGWVLKPAGQQFKYSLKLFNDKVKETIDYILKAPSKYELDRREINIAKTWKELFSTMNNKETLRKLQGIGGAVYSTVSSSLSDKKGRLVGHVLSYSNKEEVWSQDQNATFVTQEWVWRDKFNRRVVDRTRTIVITKPTTRKPRDPKAFDKACVRCGYGSAADFYSQEKNGDLSQSQIWAVRAEYNKINPADTFFGNVIVYDVANTELMKDANGNPLPDVFNDEPGLSDNRVGAPNAAADMADQQLAQSTGQQFVQGQVKPYTDDEVEEASEIIAASVHAQTGTAVSRTNDPSNDIVTNAYKLAEFLSMNESFSKDEFRWAYCEAFASAVAATFGFQTNIGANYLQKVLNYRGVDKELSTMLVMFFGAYKKFMSDVNHQLMSKSTQSKLKKSGKQISVPVPSVQKAAVEEDAIDPTQDTNFKPIEPLTPEELSEVLGVPAELFTGEVGGYENAEAVQTDQQIQESFFKLLDRIELI